MHSPIEGLEETKRCLCIGPDDANYRCAESCGKKTAMPANTNKLDQFEIILTGCIEDKDSSILIRITATTINTVALRSSLLLVTRL